jgi:hypothetical protein
MPRETLRTVGVPAKIRTRSRTEYKSEPLGGSSGQAKIG